MKETVNPDYPSSAYHCGRLLAMLAAAQRTALSKVENGVVVQEVNAGIIQRYYGAVSSTPALVLGRIIGLSQHHIAKMNGDPKKRGLAYWYETSIGEIVTQINRHAQPEGLPATFSPQEQTEFALGYYQQIAENRTKKTDKPAGVADVDPAPDTDASPDTDAE